MKKYLATLLMIALATVSCGSSEEISADPNSATTDVAALADDRPMAEASPLSAFFVESGGTENATMQFTRSVEEAISLCMLEQGHTYVPATPEKSQPRDLQSELTEFEWRQQFGYGLTTSAESMLRRSADMENTAQISTMSPAELDAWTIALTGETSENITEQRPLEEQGCVGRGLLDIGGEKAWDTTVTLGDSYMVGLESLLEAESMIEPLQHWTRCVAEQGYDATGGTQGLRTDIAVQLQDIISEIAAAGTDVTSQQLADVFAGTTTQLPGVPDETIDSLHQLQEDEITIAVIDHGCYLEHVHAVFSPLRDDYENAFVDEYRDSLTELRDFGMSS